MTPEFFEVKRILIFYDLVGRKFKMSGITHNIPVNEKIKKSKRIRKCEYLTNTFWQNLVDELQQVWTRRILEKPMSLKKDFRVQRCVNLNQDSWKDVQNNIRKIRIKRTFISIKEERKIEKLNVVTKKTPVKREKPLTRLEQFRQNPLLSYSLDAKEVFEYWQSLPAVVKVRIYASKKGKLTANFLKALQKLEQRLQVLSRNEIKEAMRKYSELLTHMKAKAPHVFRQYGFRVSLADFISTPAYNREKISNNAPHKDVASWLYTCKKSDVATMYIRFSYVGRFAIDPKHELIFNYFLGYYWKWFILPEKSVKIQKKADIIFSDLRKSIQELFDTSVIDLEKDFDFLQLTKINSAFQNYISYIKRFHKELLTIENGHAERGVRAVFKCLHSTQNKLPVFYPSNFVQDKMYEKFDQMLADEESDLAIRFYAYESEKVKTVATSNVPREVRLARRKIVEEMKVLQKAISKKTITQEDGKVKLASLRELLKNPLQTDKAKQVQKEKKRKKFEKKVLARRKRKNKLQIASIGLALEEEKKKQEQQKKQTVQNLQKVRAKNIVDDEKIVLSIPKFGAADSLLDSNPGMDAVDPTLMITNLKENLETVSDFDTVVWENLVFEKFYLRDPWHNKTSWIFCDTETNEEIKLQIPNETIDRIVVKNSLEPILEFRVWTCPNGLLFVDGDPIIRNGKDLQKLLDFEKGFICKPEFYVNWSDHNKLELQNALPVTLPEWKRNQLRIDSELREQANAGDISASKLIRYTVSGRDIAFANSLKKEKQDSELHSESFTIL